VAAIIASGSFILCFLRISIVALTTFSVRSNTVESSIKEESRLEKFPGALNPHTSIFVITDKLGMLFIISPMKAIPDRGSFPAR